MAKKPLPVHYYILGPKASLFWDPASKLKVTSTDKSDPAEFKGFINKKIQAAISGGHIIEIDAPQPVPESVPDSPDVEEQEAEEVETEKDELDGMTDAKLVKYYQDNFEVAAKDLKVFKAMTKAEKIKFLKS